MAGRLFNRPGAPSHEFPTAPVTPDQPIPQHAQWGWMDRPALVSTSVVFVGAAALFAVVASVPSHFVYAAPAVVPQSESQIYGQDPQLFAPVAADPPAKLVYLESQKVDVPPSSIWGTTPWQAPPSKLVYLEQQKAEFKPSAIWGTTPRTIVPLRPTWVLQPGSPFLPESWVQAQLQVPVVAAQPGATILVQPQAQPLPASWIASSMQLPAPNAPPVSPSWTHAWTYIGQLPELQPSNIWGTPLIDSVVPVPVVPVADTATPGRTLQGRLLRPKFTVESDEDKRERRAREAAEDEPRAEKQPELSAYYKQSARISKAISDARAEADTLRPKIAELEAKAAKAKLTAKLEKQLLHAQQKLTLISVQEAVLLEEMEAIDVAFIALIAYMQATS